MTCLVRRYRRKRSANVWSFNCRNQNIELTPREIKLPRPGMKAKIIGKEVWWVEALDALLGEGRLGP